MSKVKRCVLCKAENEAERHFCYSCGGFLNHVEFEKEKLYESQQMKIMRILKNMQHIPHIPVLWDATVDLYVGRVERYKALYDIPEMDADKNSLLSEQMFDFLDLCHKSEFQIAFVGTIKTGKSTLINSLLGHNYASIAVTPETVPLTKFRSSLKDYVRVLFYSKEEWKKLWASRTSGADAFMREYEELKADKVKNKWVGHKTIYKELANSEIEEELAVWSSSKSAEHYFVKEIEVGISSLPPNFPKQVVFVDTPGLSDPVAYRSEITRDYIRKANAVFVCVDAQKVQKEEIELLASVFSFSSHNKEKVHVIATHWDKLNNPQENWSQQKEWLKSRLVGKGFFENKEMAERNIMHSAAHIYNLCRDFPEISKFDKTTLMQFALGMDMDIVNMDQNLEGMKNYTNIQEIEKVIVDKLAANYEVLLREDIENKYLDIMHKLNRISEDALKETDRLIEMSYADMEKIEKEVEKQKANYEEINRSKKQLMALLKLVEKDTKKRLDKIVSVLDKASAK